MAKRIRQVSKWGNSYVIRLAKPDLTDYGIEEGTLVNIEDIEVIEKEKKRK
ncbi:hypothetical protein [uncultured Arcobacter sp.]|uniref:AbrB/MazE/SpoVT family DNA-binding domain-containing protein n=1 Tax=uncultured Arcobacter sp. TaxID=165434 RepID=UPI0026229F3F|nr:hypothetical protein [uncultured Arcobacter sp.]